MITYKNTPSLVILMSGEEFSVFKEKQSLLSIRYKPHYDINDIEKSNIIIIIDTSTGESYFMKNRWGNVSDF